MAGSATAAAAGTIEIGGDLVVQRMGFGAMRITGHGHLGRPAGCGRARPRCGGPWSSASTSSTPPTPTARRSASG